MYGIVKSLADGIGRLAACFLPFGLVPLCRSFWAYLYTGFVRRNFASWGEGSVMVYKPVYLLGMKYVHVGRGTVIEKEACITAYDSYDSHDGRQTFNPCIRIGDNCHIGVNVHITAIDCIEIGDNLLTGSNVLITDNAHGLFDRSVTGVPPVERPLVSKGKVRVGSNVWMGNNVCVLPGVTIGDGAVIAANSVVTHDVPSCSMVAGTPARVIKQVDSPS